MALPPPRGAVRAGGAIAFRKEQTYAATTNLRALLGALVILFCGIAFYSTEPRLYADTANYALHIVQHWQGHVAPGRDPLWEFGHVIWRPLGYLLWRITGDPQSSLPVVQAGHVLLGVSILSACVGALFFYLLAVNYTGKLWVGFTTAVALVSTHAVLNYSQTGTAYVPGGACQIVALYFFERQLRLGRDRATASWLVPGLCLGLSIIFWFPYALTVPSVLLFGLMYRTGNPRARVSLIVRSAAVASLVVIGMYAIALECDRIPSIAAAHEWYLRSRHGISQTRGYLRAIIGIPRGLLFLGDDGILWKRLLFQHNLGTHGLALAWHLLQMLWKPLVAYAFLFFVLLQLARGKKPRTHGRELLPVLLVAAGPVLFFAIVLFEAGPLERYLPVFPMLFLAAAYILGYYSRFSRAVILAFFALLLAVNLSALSRAGSHARWSATVAKLNALQRLAPHQDVLWLVSFQDDAFRMSEEQPFNPTILRAPYMHVVAELQSEDVANWRQRVGNVIFASWHTAHQVWISKRLLASEPKPDWNWVEGDDARIHWREFPAFFRRLQTAGECCGDDGYVLLAQTPQNASILRSLEPAPSR